MSNLARERRATAPPPLPWWRRWFFAVVLVAMTVRLPEIGREGQAIVLGLGGVIVGAAWQLVYRRDLVERFLPAAAIWLVVVPFALLPNVSYDLDDVQVDIAIGIGVGLVVVEAWLRTRELREVPAPPRAPSSRRS